jgi:hypothetical protein
MEYIHHSTLFRVSIQPGRAHAISVDIYGGIGIHETSESSGSICRIQRLIQQLVQHQSNQQPAIPIPLPSLHLTTTRLNSTQCSLSTVSCLLILYETILIRQKFFPVATSQVNSTTLNDASLASQSQIFLPHAPAARYERGSSVPPPTMGVLRST